MRALVLDEDVAGRRRLLELLGARPDVEIAASCGDVSAARGALAGASFDVAFLATGSREGDGFALLEGLPRPQRPVLVFATAGVEHAARAFDEAAVDFLVKPVAPERLEQALVRVRQVLSERRLEVALARLTERLQSGVASGDVEPKDTEGRLAVRARGRVTFIRHRDIEWLGASRSTTQLNADGKTFRVGESLTHLESLLEREHFVRIHRSTIVRRDRVAEVLVSSNGAYTVVLEGGQRFSVGRIYRDRVRELFASIAVASRRAGR